MKSRLQQALIAAVLCVCTLMLTSCEGESPEIDTPSLPNGQVGQFYHVLVHASGGSPGYSWHFGKGSNPPPGLQFFVQHKAMLIRGYPLSAGTFRFTIEVEDKRGRYADRRYEVTISHTPETTTFSLPDGQVGEPYSAMLAAESGSSTSFEWSLLAPGALPAGLVLDSSGTISGTPEVAGDFLAYLVITDELGANNTATFLLHIIGPELAILTTQLPGARPNMPYATVLRGGGGFKVAYNWFVSSGSLPPGLSLAGGTPNAVISGLPIAEGDYTFTLSLADGGPVTPQQEFTLRVTDQLEIETQALPGGIVGVCYEADVRCGGADGPYNWSFVGGALPPGVSVQFGDTHVLKLQGVPVEPGVFTFTLQLEAPGQTSTSREFSVNIGLPY